MSYVLNSLQLADVTLQVVFIVFLLRGFLRKYFILFLYCLTQLSATLAGEILLRRDGWQSGAYRNFYWSAEVALDLLLFLTVILLTYRALEGSPLRPKMGNVLSGVVVAAVLLPFAVFRDDVFGDHWFNKTSQMLTFGGAILNLALWTALLTSKKRDPRMLTVSIGLGVYVTGAAISYGIRQLFRDGEQLPVDLFASAMHVLGMFIWCWAFRPAAQKSAPASALTSPS